MNILSISNCQLSANQGSGFVILKTAECLRKLGHKVNLIPPETIDYFKFLKLRMRVYRTITGMAWYVVSRDVKKYDLIILYGEESFLAVFLLKKIFKCKTPIILHSNGLQIRVKYNLSLYPELNINQKKWYHFDLSKFYIWCYKNVDIIITVSEAEYNFAINNLSLKRAKVKNNNLAIDNVFYEPLKISKKKIISFCGRWSINKGAPVMREAMIKILRLYPDYKFRLIGVGESFSAIDTFGADLLNQIEVVPFVEDKKLLKDLYSESEIFLFPSLTESFGLVMPEAMICGNALVCSKTGYSESLENYKDAIILNIPNSENIIESLKLLIEDEKFRFKIASNGVLKARQLTWENYAKNLSEIINSLMLSKQA